MIRRTDGSRRRALRPSCDALESRALLTTATLPVAALPTAPTASVSIVPPNGDGNPYGVAFVPRGFPGNGKLRFGDILVSNFNARSGLQGTGTTIVDVRNNGPATVFFQGQGVGLTEALGVLKRGYVIVGSMPSTDGTAATLGQSSVLVLDRNGNVLANMPAPGGPWGLTVNDHGGRAEVFLSNVLTGTVTRTDLLVGFHSIKILRTTTIASGYTFRADPAAFEVGPSALAYDAGRDVLYVAATGDNQVFAIPNAARTRSDLGKGRLVVNDPTHLHGPIGLALGPRNTLIVANGDAVNVDPNQPSEVVVYTRQGRFLAQQSLSTTAGAGFGIALRAHRRDLTFAAVNDVTNTVDIFRGKY